MPPKLLCTAVSRPRNLHMFVLSVNTNPNAIHVNLTMRLCLLMVNAGKRFPRLQTACSPLNNIYLVGVTRTLWCLSQEGK